MEEPPSNVDIIQRHYVRHQDLTSWTSKAREFGRPFMLGEYAWNENNPSLSQGFESYLNLIDSSGVSLFSFWELSYHHEKSGWVTYEYEANEGGFSLLYPSGKGAQDIWNTREKAQLIRNKNYQIRGLAVPPHKTPKAPLLHPVENVHGGLKINWRGVVAADTYEIQRSRDNTNWQTVKDNLNDSQSSWVDNSVQSSINYYYRIRALNLAGVSSPYSNTAPYRIPAPPTTPVVTDEGQTTTNRAQLYAAWSSSDPESGISEYQYRIIQDSYQGTVIRDWTSTGTQAYITAGALNLQVNKTYYFSVKARNNANLWSNVGYSDGIRCVNQAPILSPIGNKTINENELLAFTISATDPDGGTLIYTVSNLPAGASFNTTNHTFTWTPAYNQSGAYANVHFEVNDSQATDSEDITITVTNVNRPPALSSIGDKSINENTALEFTLHGSDPDKEDMGKLTYSSTNLPEGSSLDSTTGAFTWTPTYEQSGTYNVTFTVKDSEGLKAEETISITVNNINRPPVLESIGNKSVRENETLTIELSVTDPDKDTLIYSASNLPQGATLTKNTFSFKPTYTQQGIYKVHFEASDSRLTDSQDIDITVINVDLPPEPLLPDDTQPYSIENAFKDKETIISLPDTKNILATYDEDKKPVEITILDNQANSLYSYGIEQDTDNKRLLKLQRDDDSKIYISLDEGLTTVTDIKIEESNETSSFSEEIIDEVKRIIRFLGYRLLEEEREK